MFGPIDFAASERTDQELIPEKDIQRHDLLDDHEPDHP
jgi:hypothetical protein